MGLLDLGADFNYGGFAIIKSQAGLNNYKLSVKEWIAAPTQAIGLVAMKDFGFWVCSGN